MDNNYYSYVPKHLPSSLPKLGKEVAQFIALAMQLELLSQLTECWAQYGHELRKQAREATRQCREREIYAPKLRVIEHQATVRAYEGLHRPLVGPV